MNAPSSVLRALRATIVRHHHDEHPDLAELARQLGRLVHRYGPILEDRLERRTRRLRKPSQWRLTPRRSDRIVLLCAWPPGHLVPVHEHGEAWGLEMVVRGALEMQAYRRDEEGMLIEDGHTWLGPGDGVWFDQADGYLHRARNLSASHFAWSLHVYGGPTPDLAGEPGAIARHLRGRRRAEAATERSADLQPSHSS